MTRWWWRLCQWSIRMGGSFFWQMRAAGRENIPRTGGVLLVSNHQSYLDPPIIASFLDREMHFMARRTLFRNPLFFSTNVSAACLNQSSPLYGANFAPSTCV